MKNKKIRNIKMIFIINKNLKLKKQKRKSEIKK